jgi:aerobic carbon-monoxide dehydrogenase large subunit
MTEHNGSEPNGRHVGQRMRRKEDPPLLQGRGHYIDDITLTGVRHAAFVRSPEAHARIASIDTSAALARDGVEAVFTGKDVDLESGLSLAWVPPGVEVKAPEHWPLAKEVVKHVGDPVAIVIGADK